MLKKDDIKTLGSFFRNLIVASGISYKRIFNPNNTGLFEGIFSWRESQFGPPFTKIVNLKEKMFKVQIF